MDKKEIKKLLAGMSLAALIGSAGLTATGCVATAGRPVSQSDQAIDTTERDNTDGNLSA